MENSKKQTLEEAKKKAKEKLMKRTEVETNNICVEILNNMTFPEVQSSVFQEHFLSQMRTFITTGKDPYLNEKKKTNISNFWLFTVGTLNCPVNVVEGEGPDRKIIGTLPSYLAPMKIKKDGKDLKFDAKMYDALEYKDHNNSIYLDKLNKHLTTINKDISEERIDIEAHKNKWLKALDEIEKKIRPKAETSKQTKSNEKSKNEPKKSGTEFEW